MGEFGRWRIAGRNRASKQGGERVEGMRRETRAVLRPAARLTYMNVKGLNPRYHHMIWTRRPYNCQFRLNQQIPAFPVCSPRLLKHPGTVILGPVPTFLHRITATVHQSKRSHLLIESRKPKKNGACTIVHFTFWVTTSHRANMMWTCGVKVGEDMAERWVSVLSIFIKLWLSSDTYEVTKIWHLKSERFGIHVSHPVDK